MTSQLNVDTIVDKAGSGGTNVKIGNTSTYVSDGGAVTQNTVQGLSKLFAKFQGDNASVNDSFNVSSVDDDNTGFNGVNFSNNMAAIHYATHSTTAHNYGVSNDGVSSAVASSDGEAGMTTSSVQLSHLQSGGSNGDPTAVHVTIDGDLA